MSKKSVVILHPFLFAIFPAISLVADHVRYITFNATIIGLGVMTTLLTALLFWILLKRGMEAHKAGLFVSGILFLFFSYGHVFYLITAYLPALAFRHRYGLPIWLLLAIVFLGSLRKTHIDFAPVTVFLNGVGTIFILLSIGQIVSYKWMTRGLWEDPILTKAHANSTQPKPDIYYIILDTYPNASTLQTYYNFNNQEFLDFLSAQGFYIATESFSNYGLTRLSLGSSLNMMYFGPETEAFNKDDRGFELPRQMIENNTVAQYLKRQGYQFVFLGSGQGISQYNRYADENLRCGWVDETMGRVIQSTLLWPFADALHITENDDRNRRICMFAQLADLPKAQSPKFIFVHFLLPHQPFLFNAEGDPVFAYNPDPNRVKDYYLQQLIFTNKKIEETITAILTLSPNEPIIILQGDTGPSYGYDNLSSTPEAIYRQRMRILNAIYLPENPSSFLYPSISPVNTFRGLFNQYFGAEYPLLEDQSFFSTDQAPYAFINVTEWVKFP